PALQQRGRQTHRNGRRLTLERPGRQSEQRRNPSQQNGDRVLELCPFQPYRRKLSSRALALCVGLVDVRGGCNPLLVAVAGELPRTIECLERVLQQLRLRIRSAQREVVTRQLGLQCKLHACQISRARLRFGLRGRGGVAQPAEQIDLPLQVQTGDEIVLRHRRAAQSGRQRRVGGGF